MPLNSQPMVRASEVPKSAPESAIRKDGSSIGSGVGTGQGSGIGTGKSGVVRPSKSVDVDNKADETVPPKDAAEQRQRAKLDPQILALIERLKNRAQPSAGEAKFVRNNKAEVQVWLSEKSEKSKALLKQFGFEIMLDPSNPRLLIGRIAIDKLEEFAKLNLVTYLAPSNSR
jgi:hypothetical protein